MQKKIIALAIAGAIGSIVAGSAFADQPTFYGILDLGALNTSGSSGQAGQTWSTPTLRGAQKVGGTGTSTSYGSTLSINSGIESGSRIGLKGASDVGNGVKAIYELEFGLNIDTNGANTNTDATGSNSTTNQFWNRHTYVGLTGDFGTVVGGRLEGARYSFANKYDPFAGGTVGNFGSLIGNQARADNAVAYISPTYAGGFSYLAAYSNNLTGGEVQSGGANDNTGNIRLYAIAPQYNNGPLSVTLDYESGFEYNATLAGNTTVNVVITDVGASYDLGVAKVMAYYDGLKLDAVGLDQKSMLVGATAPVGNFNFKISYAIIKDDNYQNTTTGTDYRAKDSNGALASGDCKKISVGADYNLTKTSNFFVDFAQITNDPGASCDIATSASQYAGSNAFIAIPGGFDAPAVNAVHNTGTTGLDIGFRYTF